jgi:hypothetical protein
MPAAKHVQRQIAVAIVVAVKEAALLMPVQRVVGGIEIEDDLFGRRRVSLHEQRDEQLLDRRAVVANLMVAARRQRRVLEPVERALSGERRAVLAPRLELASERRQYRIVAQLVMVDEILVPERDPADALHEHGPDGVLDQIRRAAVGEAPCQTPHQPDRPIGGAQQQRPGVRGHLPTVERSHHLAAFDHFISEQIAATLCRHRGTPLRRVKPLSQKIYRRFRAPMHLLV